MLWNAFAGFCMAIHSPPARAQVEYGTFIISGMESGSGFERFSIASSMPCEDCWITKAEVQLISPDADVLDTEPGVLLDHVVLSNTGREDSTYGGERFLVTGEENAIIDLRQSG